MGGKTPHPTVWCGCITPLGHVGYGCRRCLGHIPTEQEWRAEGHDSRPLAPEPLDRPSWRSA